MKPKEICLLADIPEVLHTERTVIRRYRHGDGEAIFELAERNGNRGHLTGIADDIAELKTPLDAEVKAKRHRAEWAKRDRFVAGIWQQDTYIGELWIEPVKWEVPSFEIGWFIDKGYEGQGFAYEAAVSGIDFIFNELDAHKVIATTDDTNIRSYKLAERLGFTKEGYIRSSEIRDGKRYGRLLFGLLRNEKR